MSTSTSERWAARRTSVKHRPTLWRYQERTGGTTKGDQLLVRKHDPDGNERWVTTIEGHPETSQVGLAVAIGPQGRIWVAGGVDQGVDGRDAYVARLAP